MSDVERLAREAGCTDLQVWTLAELAKGRTPAEIAAERGVLERGVWVTRAAAIKRIGRQPNNRHAQVLQLRAEGHTWDYIAHEMRIGRPAAIRLHERAKRAACNTEGTQHE